MLQGRCEGILPNNCTTFPAYLFGGWMATKPLLNGQSSAYSWSTPTATCFLHTDRSFYIPSLPRGPVTPEEAAILGFNPPQGKTWAFYRDSNYTVKVESLTTTLLGPPENNKPWDSDSKVCILVGTPFTPAGNEPSLQKRRHPA